MITLTRGGDTLSPPLGNQLNTLIAEAGPKIPFLISCGWKPHPAQLYFHISKSRYRVCGAGRRGGKTESAAYEFAYLCHPDYQRDGLQRLGVKVENWTANKPVMGAIVIPKTKGNEATLDTFFPALRALGIEDRSVRSTYCYNYNKNEGRIYIYGSDPDHPTTILNHRSCTGQDTASLRGAGYSLAWWDEPAFISSVKYWEAFEPSLGEFRGCCIFTTSPGEEESHWWFYDTFIDPKAQDDRTEYFEWFSSDNPLMVEEAAYYKGKKHPLLFKREYEAQWQRGAGGSLKLDWLRGYQAEEFDFRDHKRFEHYVGIDPAIGQTKDADFIGMAVIAKDIKTRQGYLVDLREDKLDIGDQEELIKEINSIWKPVRIDIEPVAYQMALVQLAQKLPGRPPVFPAQYPRGNKETRLMGLGPLFRAAQVMIDKEDEVTQNFIKQWTEFPDCKHDDLLDAVDIACRAADLYLEFQSSPEVQGKEEEMPKARTSGWLKKYNEISDFAYDEMGELWE